MKFTLAWAKIASENATLKMVILCLTVLSLFFGIAALKLSIRDPLIVERSCYSKVLTPQDSKRTTIEIEAFLREALSQRFDTGTQVHDGYLSDAEQLVRQKEQKELDSRKLAQKVVLNSFTVNGGEIAVDADRLISVGEVRSAFRFPLSVKIESIARTNGNPYGLLVSEVKAIEKGESK